MIKVKFVLGLFVTFLLISCSDDPTGQDDDTISTSDLTIQSQLDDPMKKGKTQFKMNEVFGFSIISQNVGWVSSPAAGFRHRNIQMADYLLGLDPDVIVLEEAFDASTTNSFINYITSQGNYFHTNTSKATEPPNNTLNFETGHGILILSKFPIGYESHHYYNRCNGEFLGACDADCLATKGYVHAEIEFDQGNSVRIVGTHLDAGTCSGDKTVRRQQMTLLKNYLNNYVTYIADPTLVIGDLNIDGGDGGPFNTPFDESYQYATNYQWIKNTLNSWGGFNTSFASNSIPTQKTTPSSKVLDYILIHKETPQPVNHTPQNYRVDFAPIVQNLTDHATLKADFTFPEVTKAYITSCQQYQYGYRCFHDGASGDYKWYVNGSYYGDQTTSGVFSCSGIPNIELVEKSSNAVVDQENRCSF